jgi:hypothetical protein
VRHAIFFAGIFVSAAVITGGAIAAKHAFSRSHDTRNAIGWRLAAPPSIDPAVQDRGSALLSAGPGHLSCAGSTGAALTCTPIADPDVLDAVKNGVKVYQRSVRFGIPPASRSKPLFDSDEILCAPSTQAALHCVSVISQRPSLDSNGDVVTYSPLNVKYDGTTPVVQAPGNPTVAPAP